METVTAKELRENLDFTSESGRSIQEGHEQFEGHLTSWLSLEVGEDWHDGFIILAPTGGEPFRMSIEEYKKL